MIIYFGAHAVDNGSMQVGNVMAFIQYAMQIIMSFLVITAMSIMIPPVPMWLLSGSIRFWKQKEVLKIRYLRKPHRIVYVEQLNLTM